MSTRTPYSYRVRIPLSRAVTLLSSSSPPNGLEHQPDRPTVVSVSFRSLVHH